MSVWKNTEELAKNQRPDIETLEKEDKDLVYTLRALAQFIEMPVEIQYSTPQEVQDRMNQNPAMGSKEFIQSIQSRAQTIADNAYKAPKAQSKKVRIEQCPGTGKTTGILTMTQWANVPVCMLAGEKLNAMKIRLEKLFMTSL